MIDTRTAGYGAFLLRLALGLMFLAHGLLKVFVFTIPGTVAFFHSIGYPGAVAYPVMLGEVGGGLALVIGFEARWIALALIPQMIGVVLFHLPNGWMFTAKNGGWEYPAFWTLALLVQGLIGPGVLSFGVRDLLGVLGIAGPRRALAR